MDRFSALKEIPFLDTARGAAHSGDEGMYTQIVADFFNTAENRIAALEKVFAQEDLENYTIQVHSLKSTAALVGDMELSEMAKALEKAGNDRDLERIKADTPALMDRFKVLYQALSPIFGEDENADAAKPEISSSMLQEAFTLMKQGIEDFDIDMVESVMEQLSDYRLPDNMKADYKKLKADLAEVEYDQMTETLDKLLTYIV